MNNNIILIELLKKQLNNVKLDRKLVYKDFKRIAKNLNKSIFDNTCTFWNGYITIINKNDLNSYINFYFNGKKYSLQRLLYINYIGELSDSEYIKYNCDNKGICCNINHIYKNNNIDTSIIESENINITSTDIIVGFN